MEPMNLKKPMKLDKQKKNRIQKVIETKETKNIIETKET